MSEGQLRGVEPTEEEQQFAEELASLGGRIARTEIPLEELPAASTAESEVVQAIVEKTFTAAAAPGS